MRRWGFIQNDMPLLWSGKTHSQFVYKGLAPMGQKEMLRRSILFVAKKDLMNCSVGAPSL